MIHKSWALASATLLACAAAYAMNDGEADPAANETQDTTARRASERPERAIEPRADEILRAMSDYLATASELTFHAEVTYDDIVLESVKIEYAASLDLGMRRPDSLYAEFAGDQSARRFWYDGKHMALFAAGDHVFAKVPVPSTIDAALDHVASKHGFTLPLADLAYSDPYDALTGDVRLGFYVGLHNVEGTRCHHLAFLQDGVHWQIWIEDGKQLVPRKLVITYDDLVGSPRYAAVLSDWDFAPRLPDRLFTADPPADADLIEFTTIVAGDGRDEG